ncbi:MAG TPA: hypothetical protein VFC37_11015 [Terracidiphilus sp.]|nr:hypothetical protein [Terracidiphilus sp.]
MKTVVLADWSEFEESLRHELATLRHTVNIIARNFALTTTTKDCVETNRLALVLSTGTDRDETSPFWDVRAFDHDHACDPKGKRPQDIVYAFTLDMSTTPYLVNHGTSTTSFDITDTLTQYDGIVIYDARGLRRVSENEYWFECSALDLVLLVFTVKDVNLDV